MQRIINFLYIIFITALLTLFIGAKEIVVYENDFSKSDLLGCKENGNWQIAGGVLKTESGSGSAYLTYQIPEEYKGCNYRIDVDFLDHTSTGGIMIGAEIGAAT
ncbi:MAG: hypothetical protein IKY12_06465, partial [Clostridia bacterium]|nr:hypothetical protein [Clostridia bacterium]